MHVCMYAHMNVRMLYVVCCVIPTGTGVGGVAGLVLGQEWWGVVSRIGVGFEWHPRRGAPATPLPNVLEAAWVGETKDVGGINGREGHYVESHFRRSRGTLLRQTSEEKK